MSDMKKAMEQAAKRYEVPEFNEHNHVTTTDTAISACAIYGRREGYAACLEERAIPAEHRVAVLEAELAKAKEEWAFWHRMATAPRNDAAF